MTTRRSPAVSAASAAQRPTPPTAIDLAVTASIKALKAHAAAVDTTGNKAIDKAEIDAFMARMDAHAQMTEQLETEAARPKKRVSKDKARADLIKNVVAARAKSTDADRLDLLLGQAFAEIARKDEDANIQRDSVPLTDVNAAIEKVIKDIPAFFTRFASGQTNEGDAFGVLIYMGMMPDALFKAVVK